MHLAGEGVTMYMHTHINIVCTYINIHMYVHRDSMWHVVVVAATH